MARLRPDGPSMLHLSQHLSAAADHIRDRWPTSPRVGIILGTGLGHFVENAQIECQLPYTDLPHFPQSTAIGHKGQLVLGRIGQLPVVMMQGRFHLYEGYSAQAITLPVRVMKELGIELLIVSNASGGLNPQFQSGDIMVLDDHINLMFDNPLFGVNDDHLGPRFPDMSRPYDLPLVELALSIGRQQGFPVHRGVYAAMSGPTYETRAEYRYLRQLGADVVGMSTVPEVIVAAHAGLRVMALSAVTNLCRPDTLGETSAEEVIDAAQLAEPKMRELVLGVLAEAIPT